MTTKLPTSFEAYAFSPEEFKLATSYTELQRQFIQNEICIAAESKLNLKFDPLNPLAFAQEEAELAGKIGILKYLLEVSDATQEEATSSNN